LPLHPLAAEPPSRRVLAPLPAGETVWIAVILDRGMTITGSQADGSVLELTVTSGLGDKTFVVTKAFAADDGDHPGAVVASPAASIEDTERDHVTFCFASAEGSATTHLGVVFGTPELYETLSSVPLPAPLPVSAAYGGWRLP
jgi:hypothetical protein